MSKQSARTLFFSVLLVIFISVWAIWIIKTHVAGSIVSWDEGFHGGAALYLTEVIKSGFNFDKYGYILDEFKNGVIWYPPLWLVVAGVMGVIFGPSVEIYRFSTLVFSILSLSLIGFFVKDISNIKSSIIAITALAFTPLFIIYSHLMMREVSLLFAVSLALISFYKYLTKLKLSKQDLFFIYVAFAIGVWAKIIGIVIIFGVIISTGALLFLFYKKSLMYQRFFQRQTLYLFYFTLVFFSSYRIYTSKFLNADMLDFHLNQSKQISQVSQNLLIEFILNTLKSLSLYLRDFSHMPALAIFWFGSMIGLILVKRNFLSFFLLIWASITYLIFTAVKPQSIQYILPIFAPLSISLGIFWGEYVSFKSKKISYFLTSVLVINLIWLGILNLAKTEAIGWRNIKTHQNLAAEFTANKMSYGERVLINGDGTRFLVRLAGLNKNLQIINGAGLICPEAINDSMDWAISDFGPQNPVRLSINSSNWQKINQIQNEIEPILIYKNISSHKLVLQEEEVVNKRCARWFKLGKNKITFSIIPKKVENFDKKVEIHLWTNSLKPVSSLYIKPSELNKRKDYNLIFNQDLINRWVFYTIKIPKNVEVDINKVVAEKIN